MKLFITSIGLSLGAVAFAGSTARISKQEYVDQWKAVAIEQMSKHNIPASITLAQAILESGSGNSMLARKANNHFGIKCHGWKGKKVYKDDDRKGECFRVYKSAQQSYDDHSEFLNRYDRYAFLFDYDVTDYKSWAKGLKKAGYATNPKYPKLLIDLIEDLDLAQYDQLSVPLIEPAPELIVEQESAKEDKKESVVVAEVITIQSNRHDVRTHNSHKVKYVVVKKGDTFYRIAQEFGLTLRQLYRYNDFGKEKDVLIEGDIVYIQPKKRANIFKREEITADKDMSINELSQKYAMNAKSILRLNKLENEEDIVHKDERVTLR